MKTYRIHLIRHGQTMGNAQGQYVGSTDLPLTTEGIKQLHHLKESADYPAAPVVFSSPLQRCLQTAEILYPDCRPIVVDDFRECDFGEYGAQNSGRASRRSALFGLAGRRGQGRAAGRGERRAVCRPVYRRL